jgi:tetratricopeptide (TPR) repeat protein
MNRTVFGVAIWLIASLGVCQTVPKVLLVQRLVPTEAGTDINVNLRLYFSSEIDENGRLEALTWSIIDPAFRKATESKVLKDPPENPTDDQAFEAMSKLGCEYVMFVRGMRHQNNIFCDAELFRGKRQIWKNNTSLGAEIQDRISLESTIRSIARTWLFQLESDALKGLKPKPIIKTPEPDPTPVINRPAPQNDPISKADFSAILAEFERLAKLGERRSAVALLRDAVDQEPVDWERRAALIGALMRFGNPEEAVSEARRATGLFPEVLDLWRFCARGALLAGDGAQAIRDLNEAISRDPEDAVTRCLLGEAQLVMGRLDFALEHFDAALAKSAMPEALHFRAIAFALKGDMTKSKIDIELASKSMPDVSTSDRGFIQRLTIRLLYRKGDEIAANVRSLVQRSRLQPSLAANLATAKSLNKSIEGLLFLCATTPPTDESVKPHDSVSLALNLLGQCVIEVQSFLSNKSEDMLGDATITLGEALKALAATKDLLDRTSV